jgi:hypothetical protein
VSHVRARVHMSLPAFLADLGLVGLKPQRFAKRCRKLRAIRALALQEETPVKSPVRGKRERERESRRRK